MSQQSNPSAKDFHAVGLVLSFYAFIAIGMVEGGLGVLLPSIMQAFNQTPATVTLLFLSQISGYIVAAFTSSLLSHCIGLAKMLFIASSTLTIALILYATVPAWFLMVATGTCLGLGIGLTDAGINTYIVNTPRHSRFIGLLHGFYGIGALLGPAIATLLLSLQVHWRLAYLVFASIAGLFVVGIVWAIMMGNTSFSQPTATSTQDAKANLRIALQTPAVLISGLLLLLYVGTEVSIGNWAYSVQTISRQTSAVIAGYSISAYWMGLTIGRLAMGLVIKRFGALRTIDGSLLLLLLGLEIWWQFPNQLWSLPLMGLALAAIFPTTMLLVPQRIAVPFVPAAIGFLTSIGSLGAASIPTGVGWIANIFGLEVIPVLMLPLTLLMLGLHRWLSQNA